MHAAARSKCSATRSTIGYGAERVRDPEWRPGSATELESLLGMAPCEVDVTHHQFDVGEIGRGSP